MIVVTNCDQNILKNKKQKINKKKQKASPWDWDKKFYSDIVDKF